MENWNITSISWFINYFTDKVENKKLHDRGGFSLEYYESELLYWKEKYKKLCSEKTEQSEVNNT